MQPEPKRRPATQNGGRQRGGGGNQAEERSADTMQNWRRGGCDAQSGQRTSRQQKHGRNARKGQPGQREGKCTRTRPADDMRKQELKSENEEGGARARRASQTREKTATEGWSTPKSDGAEPNASVPKLRGRPRTRPRGRKGARRETKPDGTGRKQEDGDERDQRRGGARG